MHQVEHRHLVCEERGEMVEVFEQHSHSLEEAVTKRSGRMTTERFFGVLLDIFLEFVLD